MGVNTSICFVVTHPKYLIGGSEIQSYLIAKELLRRGWQVSFATECHADSVIEEEILDGISVYGLKKRPMFRFLGFAEIYAVLKKINADVYYQRGIASHDGITAYFSKREKKHFVWACALEDDCRRNNLAVKIKLKNKNIFKRIIFTVESIINDWLKSFARKNATAIFAQTKYQQELLKKSFGIDSIMIRNGHPVPQNLGRKVQPPIVLWLASIKRRKQPEVFIQLAQKCENLRCKFVMAGQVQDKRYFEELKKQITKLTNIDYIGNITFEKSNQLIEKSTIFVNTSTTEGFPNTMIQAWLRKTPTVSLNVDPDNLITENQIGFHSETFDHLVYDVRYLIKHRDAAAKIGHKAREFAIANFSLSKNIDYLEKFLKELLR